MRMSAIDAAKKFANEKFPNSDFVLLAGSAARGEETDTSDLDIIIFDAAIENSYRESFILYDWKIETFIHNYSSYLKQFELDRDIGRPILATMIVEGKIIKDHTKITEVKSKAEKFIEDGPAPLSEQFINASRYFMYDLLDDFQDSQIREEELITLNTITIQLVDFILRLNSQWSGRGKGLARAFKKYDEQLYNRFFESLDAYYKRGEKKPLINFVNDIYKPLGGPLFDGFKQ